MLEIREVSDGGGYSELRERLSGVIKLHITEAVNGEEPIGFIAYSYEGDRTDVYDMDDGGDLRLCDGLIRSVLFKSCLKAIGKAVFLFDDEAKLEKVRKLGFVPKDGNVSENIDSFMNGCENCKKKN